LNLIKEYHRCPSEAMQKRYSLNLPARYGVKASCSEFDRPMNTGTHTMTTEVDCPKKEGKAVFEPIEKEVE
jgi:hypothetical protein